MNFSSIQFILFFIAVIFLYSVMPSRFRWFLLLTASYLFYAFLKVPHLLIVLALVTAISFFVGQGINKVLSSHMKKILLWVGILSNLSILVWLKYIPFLIENLNLLLNSFSLGFNFHGAPHLVAIGASYFIFQSISYLVDIYLELIEPEKHLGHLALSLSFFPKLLQGPIERSGNLLPQLYELLPVSRANLWAGVNLFIWGMFKKIVIADRLASFVDPVYNNVHNYFGLPLVIATYLYAFQIYFDFSGYTDMALGLARCFNIRLTQNFNSPYLAISTPDFWRRWHISFSSWILDYIFKPLQFSFRDFKTWGTPIALFVTFFASGIWHGASWCYIVWGTLHGIYLSTSSLLRKRKQKFVKSFGLDKSFPYKCWQIFATFHLVCFAWIFFRASTISDAAYVVRSSIIGTPRSLFTLFNDSALFSKYLFLGRSAGEFIFVLLLIVAAAFVRMIDRKKSDSNTQLGELSMLSKLPTYANACIYGVLIYLIAFNGADVQSFIYQQF